MSRHITITTPENVRIEYELAGPASRAGAALVDLAVQGSLILLLGAGVSQLLHRADLAGWAAAANSLAAFAVLWGYYTFFETLWNGQTPGKRLSGLRTVRRGGLPLDLASAAIRNLVRVIDFLPLLYIIGGVAMLLTRSSQRLGDLAAGTLVIRERAQPVSRPADTAQIEREPVATSVRNVELVTAEEFEAVKRFLDRSPELSESVRESVAARIAAPLTLKLGIDEDPRIAPSRMLADIYSECMRVRGMR